MAGLDRVTQNGPMDNSALPQTLDFKTFRHGKSTPWCDQQNSSTVELVDYIYDGRAGC